MNAYNFYINTLLEDIDYTQEFITGTYGLTNMVFVILSIFLIHAHGRKTLLFWGFLGMGCFQMLVAISLYQKMVYLTFFSVLGFVSCMAISTGPITWLYMAEVMDDKGLSVGTFILQSFTLLISAVTLPIKSWLGPEDVGAIFIFYGIHNFWAVIFTYIFVEETRGKTSAEI